MFSGNGDTDGGSDDECSASANSVMPASADGDRRLAVVRISYRFSRRVEGFGWSSAPPPPRSSFAIHPCLNIIINLRLSSDDNYHHCLLRRQDGQQDPPQGHSHPPPDRSRQCSPMIGL
ncbi:hypothetical protein Tco_1082903 [Tanacetum coccineum]|uniref:Uncharacterized protein n=1 Tax=Tanacetum coccineum TaxID=301880 RepID=A0ABQ5I3V4_9ASTR